jgi:hypothetical protein
MLLPEIPRIAFGEWNRNVYRHKLIEFFLDIQKKSCQFRERPSPGTSCFMVPRVSKNITLIVKSLEIREDLLAFEDESNMLFETSESSCTMRQRRVAERGNPQPLCHEN